jgi:hypothetical protein
MDVRRAGLSECKAKRKINGMLGSGAILFTEFTPTPLNYLLGFATEQPPNSIFDHSATFHSPMQHAIAPLDQSTQDEDYQVPELPMWHDLSALELAKMVPSNNQRSLSTYISTSSLRRRLPRYSNQYLKGISRLLRHLSISGTSAATITEPAHAMQIGERDKFANGSNTFLDSLLPNGLFATATLPLANAFLNIDRWLKLQGICLPGLTLHESKSC